MANNKKGGRNNNIDDDNVRIRKPKRKVCAYCADKNLVIDYKQVDKLKKYVSEKGKILPKTFVPIDFDIVQSKRHT